MLILIDCIDLDTRICTAYGNEMLDVDRQEI
jgi:hypothetical protein